MNDFSVYQAVPESAAGQPSIFLQFLPFIAVLGVMYFLLIRPQQKRARARSEMLAALKRGDTVVTAGGIIGKITKVQDDEILLDAGEGVKVRVVRAMIAERRESSASEQTSSTTG